MSISCCYWFTGLSASGKTTYSKLFAERLRSCGLKVVILDGDKLRSIMNCTSFSRSDRLRLGYQYFSLANLIVSQGLIVIVAAIGMFHELRQWNRDNIENYYEVFLDVPKDVLVRRDPKGIYKKFFFNQLSNISGFDLEVDLPTEPDFHFRWEKEGSFDDIVEVLYRHFLSQDVDSTPR